MTLPDLHSAPPAKLDIAILRARDGQDAMSARAGDGMPTLVGHFSVFNNWYRISSWMEGDFLERIAPGAFKKTIRESIGQMKVLYDHGMDPSIGNKVLGPIASLEEDGVGPAYEVPLLDTSYNRDLAPGLEAGVYGSSFRFVVIKDAWNMEPKRSEHNPDGVPERTITEARVMEFGPVTFPANPEATAGARSLTDRYYENLRARSPEQFESVVRSISALRTPAGQATGAATPPAEPASEATPEPAVQPAPVKERAQSIQRARALAGMQETK